ncbi:MAG: septum formation inhibitor Maf [Deltaproteobacteria bacterium]|nr:septum formation inhibitor Maf [Deltaproteobacteria bacterium]
MELSFVLASKSPRRRVLLTEAGFNFSVVPPSIDESFRPGEIPRDHVLRLSREKARAVAVSYPDNWVLGADTIVMIDGEVLGKPKSPQDARDMLWKLSGREHRVLTGFTLVKECINVVMSEAVESRVLFKTIPDDEIEWYIQTSEPYDKAGGYAVQGMAAFFIREIHGSYTNVVGLPLSEVVESLKRVGAVNFHKRDQ